MKPKKIKKYLVIKEETLKSKLNVFFGFSFEEVNKILSDRKFTPVPDINKGSLGVTWCERDDKGVPYYTIWIPSPEWNLVQQSVIGHELTHICFWMCSDKGVDIIKDSPNETFAYLWEFFFLELCRKLSKYLERKPRLHKRKKRVI